MAWRYRDKASQRFVSKRAWERSHGPSGKYVRVTVKPRVSEEPAEPPGPPPEPVPRRHEDYDDYFDFDLDFDLGEEEYGEVTL